VGCICEMLSNSSKSKSSTGSSTSIAAALLDTDVEYFCSEVCFEN
jgi:hypothetical protein